MVNNIPDSDKYFYSGYGISIDVRKTFSLPSIGLGKNLIILDVDMGSPAHIDDKKIT